MTADAVTVATMHVLSKAFPAPLTGLIEHQDPVDL